jgi:site-specific recombinase XerD
MDDEPAVKSSTRRAWSTKKKDKAPKGVCRHPSGGWAIRYTCGAGHIHKEHVGRVKQDAKDARDERHLRAKREPGWCPVVEMQHARAQAKEAQRRERARVSFSDHAEDFIGWAKIHHRSWAKDDSRLSRVKPVLGEKKLDEITTADIEHFLASLREGDKAVAPATVNRYRDLLSGLFKRAKRLGLVPTNPVQGIPKLKEAGGRMVYLPPGTRARPAFEEEALAGALPKGLRPLFTVAVHTGLRWSEQAALRWKNVDMLNGTLTVARSKNGDGRVVPLNEVARSVLLDRSLNRQRPQDGDEHVFDAAYRTTARAFNKAVNAAQAKLREAGKDATLLTGYTWHCNRHTFASRLVMSGADLLSVQRLGGWRTLSMVQRYAHLAPDHLRAAVDRLVSAQAPELARN